MLPRFDLITVNPVGRAEPAKALDDVTDVRQEAFQRAMSNLLGRSLQGQVLSRLTDGSYLVKVAGTPARMQLPAGAKVGAEVSLTLVSVTPRPTFQIGTGQGPPAFTEAAPALPHGAARAAPLAYQEHARPAPDPGPATQAAPGATLRTSTHATALLGKAPLTPADQLPAADADSTPTSLSPGARVITNVLRTAMAGDSAPTAIIARTPLLASATVPAAQVAVVLKDAIGTSGLFYESHVAEWSQGKRALPELLREPQMQKALASPENAARQAAPAADAATAQFINLQLSTQEQARVAWQGQVWPGQHMQWEIHKDAPERGPRDGHGEAGSPVWRSGVRFRFPLLGDIGATVVIAGEKLYIQVDAGSSATGALLRARSGELTTALAAAGTPLASLDIRVPQDSGDE
jgi:hypothetical protein